MTRDEHEREPRDRAVDPRPLGYTPGPLEEKETAAAYANRTQQRDTTSRVPEGAALRGGAPDPPGREDDAARDAPREDGPEGEPEGDRPALDSAADPMR